MQPTNSVFSDLATLLSTDTLTLAPAVNACKAILFQNNVVPSQSTIAGDLVEADFGGYAAILGVAGAQNVAIDPLSAEYLVEMKIPAGGWRWTVTSTTNLPQTIYGVALMNNAKSTLFGAALFDTPILLQTVGQVVETSALRFRFLFAGIS